MEAPKDTTTQNKPVYRSRVMKSLQEAMITMDMSHEELVKYHEIKYKRCYGCNAKNKTYKNSCNCYKKKKCSGCHKLIRQCMNESIYCDDQSENQDDFI
jgi:hypothetical protein